MDLAVRVLGRFALRPGPGEKRIVLRRVKIRLQSRGNVHHVEMSAAFAPVFRLQHFHRRTIEPRFRKKRGRCRQGGIFQGYREIDDHGQPRLAAELSPERAGNQITHPGAVQRVGEDFNQIRFGRG